MYKIQHANNAFVLTCPNVLWIGEDWAAAATETSRLDFWCSGCWVTLSCHLLPSTEPRASTCSLSTLWQQLGALSIQLHFVCYVRVSIPGFLLLSGGFPTLWIFCLNFLLFLSLRPFVVTGSPFFLYFRGSRLREGHRFTIGLIGKLIFRDFSFDVGHADVWCRFWFPAGVRWLDGTGQHVTEKMHVSRKAGNRPRLRVQGTRRNQRRAWRGAWRLETRCMGFWLGVPLVWMCWVFCLGTLLVLYTMDEIREKWIILQNRNSVYNIMCLQHKSNLEKRPISCRMVKGLALPAKCGTMKTRVLHMPGTLPGLFHLSP